MPEEITSLQNPRIKSLVRLRRRRERDRIRRFLIEGYREVKRAISSGITIETLYACKDLFLGPNENALISEARSRGTEIVPISPDAFGKVSYRDRAEGLIAVAEHFDTGLPSLGAPDTPLYLVIESIEKPGNLGTMLRTADAAGVSAVIVVDPTTDPFNPNVVRASLGCLFTVPLAISTSEAGLSWLRERRVRVVATTPDAPDSLWHVDLAGATALVIGSEQYGLSATWLENSDDLARIPMHGDADSLNAAMAAGVVLFEALRQRNG